MLKKRARVPRAHAQTVANAPPPPNALRATIVHRVPQPVVDQPMAIVQRAQHAPTASVRPPASAPPAHSMTVRQPGIALLAASALTANVPHMVTVLRVVKDLTASAHRAPVVLTQTALVQTALDLTGQLLTGRVPTAQVVTSVPLASAPVVRRARSMTAPATANVPRAPWSRTSFTMRLPLFRSLLIQQRAWSLATWVLVRALLIRSRNWVPQRRLRCRLQPSPWH